MKREIKFRGLNYDFDSNSTRWAYGSLITPSHPSCDAIIVDWGIKNGVAQSIHLDVVNDSVGQFTGLKDKNGVEIYEGDILLYNNGTKAIVIFHFGSFCGYDGFTSSSDEAYLRIDPEDCPIEGQDFTIEVIGNIHEKPELLK